MQNISSNVLIFLILSLYLDYEGTRDELVYSATSRCSYSLYMHHIYSTQFEANVFLRSQDTQTHTHTHHPPQSVCKLVDHCEKAQFMTGLSDTWFYEIKI